MTISQICRWLYWCDVLGLLVWVEMPSPYRFTGLAVERLREWMAALTRDLSHPCARAAAPARAPIGHEMLFTPGG